MLTDIEAPPVQALVLAAGQGRGLAPITDGLPAALVPFFGAPVLAYALAQLQRAGVTRVALTLGHLGAALASWLEGPARERFPGLELHLAWELERRPTATATTTLGGWLRPGALWVLDGDVVFTERLASMAAASHGHSRVLAPHGAPPGATGRSGVVLLSGSEASELADAAEEALPVDAGALTLGTALAHPSTGFWARLDTPESYLDAHLRAWPSLPDLLVLGVHAH